jgi:uncharacterized membrane protein
MILLLMYDKIYNTLDILKMICLLKILKIHESKINTPLIRCLITWTVLDCLEKKIFGLIITVATHIAPLRMYDLHILSFYTITFVFRFINRVTVIWTTHVTRAIPPISLKAVTLPKRLNVYPASVEPSEPPAGRKTM